MLHSLIPSLAAFLAVLGFWPAVVIIQSSAVTPVTQILIAHSNDVFVDSTTEYMNPYGFNSVIDTTEANHEAIMLAGTISELRIQLTGGIGPGGTAQFILRKCDPTCADTALTCTIAISASACSDTDVGHAVPVAAGDRITIAIVTGAVANTVSPSLSMKWVGTNSNESMLISSYNADHLSNTECAGASGAAGSAVTCTAVAGLALPAPETFTIAGLYARAAADLGVLDERVVSLYLNGSSISACQVTLNDGTQAATDACSSSFATATPDRATVEDNPGATNTHTGFVAFTLALTSTAQHFMAGACVSGSAPSITTTQYSWPIGNVSWNNTEANRDAISNGFTQTAFMFRGDVDPTPGNFTYTLRDDVAGAVGCTVAAGQTGCSTTGGSSVIADASMLAIQSVPASSPTTGPSNWCASWAGAGS